MLKEYRHSHGANAAFTGAATNTPDGTGIWAPIERAKQLAMRGLKFSLPMVGAWGKKHAWSRTKNARSAKRIACRDYLLDCSGLRVQ